MAAAATPATGAATRATCRRTGAALLTKPPIPRAILLKKTTTPSSGLTIDSIRKVGDDYLLPSITAFGR